MWCGCQKLSTLIIIMKGITSFGGDVRSSMYVCYKGDQNEVGPYKFLGGCYFFRTSLRNSAKTWQGQTSFPVVNDTEDYNSLGLGHTQNTSLSGCIITNISDAVTAPS